MNDEKDKELRCDAEPFSILWQCSNDKDIGKWQEWLNKYPTAEIWLEGANFEEAILCGADLSKAHLKEAKFVEADLRKTILYRADLKAADLTSAKLQKASLREAYLRRARIESANIRGAKFNLAEVDGVSLISDCEFDSESDFTGVGLDSARIDPGLKAALKNNIRRIHWQKWFDTEQKKGFRNRVTSRMVKWFWWVSDYGRSTKRIIQTFFVLAFGFGLFYWLMAYVPSILFPSWEGIIQDLKQGTSWIGVVQTFWRSQYFSIVTMTTLGFGDMHAVKGGFLASLLGDFVLSGQVLLGYVLLGALVTRLGILFTSEAPAAAPSPAEAKGNKDD